MITIDGVPGFIDLRALGARGDVVRTMRTALGHDPPLAVVCTAEQASVAQQASGDTLVRDHDTGSNGVKPVLVSDDFVASGVQKIHVRLCVAEVGDTVVTDHVPVVDEAGEPVVCEGWYTSAGDEPGRMQALDDDGKPVCQWVSATDEAGNGVLNDAGFPALVKIHKKFHPQTTMRPDSINAVDGKPIVRLHAEACLTLGDEAAACCARGEDQHFACTSPKHLADGVALPEAL